MSSLFSFCNFVILWVKYVIYNENQGYTLYGTNWYPNRPDIVDGAVANTAEDKSKTNEVAEYQIKLIHNNNNYTTKTNYAIILSHSLVICSVL